MWKIIFGKRQKPPTFAVAFKHVYYSAFLSLHPFIYVDIFQLDFIPFEKVSDLKKQAFRPFFE